MEKQNGIIIDLFPPTDWSEESVVLALQIQEGVDSESSQDWQFSSEEIAYLAKCISYYMGLSPELWGDNFMVDDEIDFDDPETNGRIIIDLSYPSHLEAPASLR